MITPDFLKSFGVILGPNSATVVNTAPAYTSSGILGSSKCETRVLVPYMEGATGNCMGYL